MVLATVALTSGLSACATGFDAQTVQVYNAPSGTNLYGGGVNAMGSLLVTADGGGATLVTGLVGPFESDDALTAAQVTDSEGNTVPATISGGSLDIPADTLVQTADDAAVTFSTDSLEPGRLVTVTLAFERSATVSGQVPVVAAEGPYADVPPPASELPGRTTPEGAPEPTDTSG